MPNIKEYQQRTNAQSGIPTGRGIYTGNLDPGRGLQTAVQGLGNVASMLLQRAEQQDVSDLHVAFSKAHEEFATRLNKQSQDGTLDVDQFKQDYSAYMDTNVRAHVKTPAGEQFFKQQYASQHSDFTVAWVKASSTLAGDRAVQNHLTARDTTASTLVNNPSGFDSAVAMNRSALQAQVATGGLPADAATKLDRQDTNSFAESAVRGWIKLTPELAKQQLDQGKWDAYVSGDIKKQLYGEADTAITARRQEQERIRIENERLLEKQRDISKDEIIAKMTKDAVPVKAIIESNLSPEDKVRYLKLNETVIDKKEQAAYGANFQSLLQRIHAPANDPMKITNDSPLVDEAIRGNLTMPDLDRLRNEMAGRKNPKSEMDIKLRDNFMSIVRAKLDPGSNDITGIQDPNGKTRVQAFLSFYYPEYERRIAAGKSPSQLLTPPKPGYPNPDYMGNHISDFMAYSMQEQISSMAREYNTSIPGLLQPGNIDLTNRPRVKNADGSISTLRSFSANVDGREVLLPTVTDDGKIISEEQAIEQYKKTKKNLGIFDSPEAATAYAQKLHKDQENMIKKARNPGETPAQYLERMKAGK